MLSTPTVSVCIPVFNGQQFLAEAIGSVLDQSHRDFELVVVDNASTDDTNAIAHSFGDARIRVERNPTTIPVTENWQRAVQLCRAPLVKLVCADDLLHPHCLRLQVDAMHADPGLAVVAARRHLVDEHTQVLVPRRGLRGLTGVKTSVEVARTVVRSGGNPIGEPGGVLFRRADYTAVGGWRAKRPWVMDLDLWMRLLSCGDFLGLPEALAAFRIAAHGMTAANDAGISADQRAIVTELVETPHLRVRPIDAAIGRVRAPLARSRRRALVRWSSRIARRERQGVPVAW